MSGVARPIALLALVLAMAGFAVRPALADEGMWTFDNFPAAAVQKAYGVKIDQAWLDHVRLSALRLSSGCSASVVSGRGLAMTNYHCVVDCVQSLSGPQNDLVHLGFQAAGPADERRCPGLQAEILLGMSDVTDQIMDVAPGPSGLKQARDAVIGRIEKDGCGADPTLHCQVVSLYYGGQYMLYRYRKYADVRLVFAPEFDTGFFGGDPDNFNFPRYDLDVGFLRLYEDDKPALPPDHLTWSAAAPKAGEPVFVAGNPGGTERQLTLSQLQTQRDLVLPVGQLQRSEERGRLLQFSAESPEHARVATDALFSLENSFKVFFGRQFDLSDPPFLAIKERQEADLRDRVNRDPALRRKIGDPWAEMVKAQAAYAELFVRYRQIDVGAGNLSELYNSARTLVRAAAERAKPSKDRLLEYTDARLPLLERDLFSARPIDTDLETLYLGFWLSKTREYLTADDPDVMALLGGRSPEALARALAQGTHLADPAARRALWDGGQAAIDASDDPMIRFVLSTDEAARKLRKQWNERVTTPVDEASQRIAEARFAVYGRGTYPDATFSLRLT